MNGRKNLNFPPKVLYKNRYCNQDNFSILVCGGRDKSYKAVKSVYKLDGQELKCKKFTSMLENLIILNLLLLIKIYFFLAGTHKLENYLLACFLSKQKINRFCITTITIY